MTDMVEDHAETAAVTEDPAVAETEVIDPENYGRSGEPHERAAVGRPYVQPVRLAVTLGFFAAIGLWRGWTIMVVIGAVLLMIFFHELGHFVMARRAGMKVTEFMIGFGPRIFSFRRGEVEYGLKAIPAGAYVKIIGMANVEEVPPEDESRTYRQKGYWSRMGVAVAGSTAHFIMALGLIMLSLVFVGRSDPENWIVETVAAESAAATAGVQPGDRVVSIDGVATDTFEEMAAAAQERPGERVAIGLDRDGRLVESTTTITPRFLVYGTRNADLQVYGNAEGGVSISLPEQSPHRQAGFRDGDVIVAADGVSVESVDQLKGILGRDEFADNGSIPLTVSTPGSTNSRTLTLDMGRQIGTDETRGFFGVGQEIVPEKLSVIEAVPASVDWFADTTTMTVSGMASFFSPSNLASFVSRTFTTAPGADDEVTTAISSRDSTAQSREEDSNRIVSIVGAVALGQQLSEDGWGQLLVFLAFLNMAIGLLNLIPLPPFDGGHVAIGTYERLRELMRRDGKRYMADYDKIMPLAVAVVSFMLIVGLMAIYLDLADPIRL